MGNNSMKERKILIDYLYNIFNLYFYAILTLV